MAFEVVCGQCHGGLLVETGGVVVACPHCGAHLTIEAQPEATPQPEAPAVVVTPPAPIPPPAPPEPAQVTAPPVAAPPTAEPASGSEFQFMSPAATPPVAPPPVPPASASPAPGGFPDFSGLSQPEAESDFPDFSQFGQAAPAAATPTPPVTPPAPVVPEVAAPTAQAVQPTFPTLTPPTAETGFPNLGSPAPPATDFPNLGQPTPPVAPATAAPVVTPPPAPPVPAAATPSLPDFSGLGGDQGSTGSTPDAPAFPDFAAASAAQPAPAMATPVVSPAIPSAPVAVTPVAASPVVTTATATPAASVQSASPSFSAASAATPAESISIKATPRESKGISPFLFLLVISYASAVTLAFAYLLMSGRGSGGNLDLPDFPPTKSLTLLKEEMTLPASHRLKLGESTQFGNIVVTPLRVTRGPLQFVHYKDPGKTREPSGEVLKLWLKFENVSKDQEIAPLDKRLVFTVVPDKKNPGFSRANNFVCQESEKRRDGYRLLVYSMSASSEWELKGQKLDTPLKPEMSEETYIPTNDEDLDSLKGDLVWRVHLRKGYNRRSGNGVTTIFEVDFKGSDIKKEKGAADATAEKNA